MAGLRTRLLHQLLRPLGWLLARVPPGGVTGGSAGPPDFMLPRGVVRREAEAPLRGEWIVPNGADPDERVILYLHGGGYVVGSPATHRGLTARLANEAGVALFAARYRLAPDHPCPAAIEDALEAWRALRAKGLPAGHIALAGDSAGGGLVLAVLQALAASGEPVPACAVTFSAWTDLTASGASVRDNKRSDTLLSRRAILRGARAYAGPLALDDPRVSPLFGAFEGLPPLLMWAGSTELLLDDTRRAVERARAAGVQVRAEIVDGAPHAWPVFTPLASEAEETIRSSAAFLSAALSPQPER